jgi:hypothetical protein
MGYLRKSDVCKICDQVIHAHIVWQGHYFTRMGGDEPYHPEDCPTCPDGSGWEKHPAYGWVACATCNDDMQRPKPDNPKFEEWDTIGATRE